MTQELIPISDTLNTWLIIGAGTATGCIDDTIGGSDGNTTYIRGGPSASNTAKFRMSPGITTGGVYTGWSVELVGRRFGAIFNPADEPRIQVDLFAGPDSFLAGHIASTELFFSGGTSFTQYSMPLTATQAQQCEIAGLDLLYVHLTNNFVAGGTHVRLTLMSMLLADPLIRIDPCPLTLGFGQTTPVLGGQSERRGAFAQAGLAAGAIVSSGPEKAQVNRCP